MQHKIYIEKTDNKKTKPDQNNLGFGNYFTDHMFIMDYSNDKGWHDARIVPYKPIEMDPATMVLHYGQGVFEGLKAYISPSNSILLFRPEKNMQRLNISNERLCIPQIDVDFAVHAIKELIKLEREWIPTLPGTSLYIRPFIFATDPYLGVKASNTYKFIIILSPVGSYYKEGINPVKIHVENKYVRAVKGGIGHTKAPANYIASLKAQVEAHDNGYSQVLWLDGVERKYVEEVGTMNVFFKIGDEVITPSLEGSILAGVTRLSVIELLNHWGVKISERKISINEIYEAHKKNLLQEAFGTGTAAVISPIGELNWDENIIYINDQKIGDLASRLYNHLTGIQTGMVEDTFGWTVII